MSADFLLIEDSEDHVVLIKKFLKPLSAVETITVYDRANIAWADLKERNDLSSIVIILDLNLPGMCGLEFLERIKQNNRTKNIPVVVLTTSNAESDRSRAYELGVNSYLVKPTDFSIFKALIQTLGNYWGDFNTRV